MTTLPVIIIAVAACLLGGATGAMWGLSQHRHIYDWLSANIISRMQQAMHSCGYKQDEIDMVTQRMGMRIMPLHIPCPPPPEKKEQAERVEWCKEAIVPESEENLLQLLTSMNEKMILNYVRLGQYEELARVCDLMLDRWKQLTTLPSEYHPRFEIKIRYADFKATGIVTVIFSCRDTD